MSVISASLPASSVPASRVNALVGLTAGANNVFNIYPNKLSAVNQGATGFAFYNAYSPYGFSGGSYYGKINFGFQ
jgi:iron complex outermembrane receptor protein